MKNNFNLQYLIPIFLFLSILILTIPSYANSTKNSIQMVIMHQSPYGFKTQDGKETGVLYDILTQIIKTSNMHNSINIVPIKRLLVILKKNPKVCTIVANTPDIKEFDLIEPISFLLAAGILPGMGINVDTYASLKNKVIAVPLGIIFDEKFHKDKTLIKVRPPHYSNAIKMLKRGRVDAVAGALPTLMYIAKKEGMNIKSLNKPLLLAQTQAYLVCTKDLHKSNRDKLKKAVIELKSNGTIQKILFEYFGI